MSQVLRVISFNVGGWKDSERLTKLAENKDVDESTAVAWYQEKVKEVVKDGKIYSQEADILCLQEFHEDSPEKKELSQRIRNAGFTILGEGDLAIAYKTERFTSIEGKQGTTEGRAFYAYLRDNITQRTICVVTDHVRGFDSRMQKIYTRAVKESINPWSGVPWQGSQKNNIADVKKTRPSEGDTNLTKSLQEIGQDADLIVYGLDANTTADYIPKGNHAPRLHPKRLKKFIDAGYKCDTKDTAPTIIEHNLDRRFVCKDPAPGMLSVHVRIHKDYNLDADVSMKLDYVFVRPKEGLEISITSQALGPLPQEFEKLLSDHRPVYTEIRLQSLGFGHRLFSAIFNGFMGVISFLWRGPMALFRLFASKKIENLSPPMPRIDMEQFEMHFQSDANYTYLKAHAGNNLGLLLAAEITPEELVGYFTKEKSLKQLLDAKNALDTHEKYNDTPAQICEFFIVWCVLKKLQGESWKIKFETYVEFRKNLRNRLKQELEKLRDNPSSEVEQKCAAYIRQHMQSADLLKPSK